MPNPSKYGIPLETQIMSVMVKHPNQVLSVGEILPLLKKGLPRNSVSTALCILRKQKGLLERPLEGPTLSRYVYRPPGAKIVADSAASEPEQQTLALQHQELSVTRAVEEMERKYIQLSTENAELKLRVESLKNEITRGVTAVSQNIELRQQVKRLEEQLAQSYAKARDDLIEKLMDSTLPENSPEKTEVMAEAIPGVEEAKINRPFSKRGGGNRSRPTGGQCQAS